MTEDMGIDGPERASAPDLGLWVVTYTDPPSSYIAALQVCKDELAPCSFLVVRAGFDGHQGSPGPSYRIVDIQRFPHGSDDMVKVFFVDDMVEVFFQDA